MMVKNTQVKICCPYCLHESLRVDKCTHCGVDLNDEDGEEKEEVLCIPYWIELTVDLSNLDISTFPKVFAFNSTMSHFNGVR